VVVISSKGIVLCPPWIEPKNGASAPAQPSASLAPKLFGESLIFRQESIKALLRSLSVRDPYTGIHSNRVTNIALTFARALSLSSQELQALSNAGYLHDIGKIGVCDSILLKPAPLTPDERAIIETHPLIGEKIVEPLYLTSREKDLILLHHEHWNGQGYPYGLSGTNIPLLCRVLALADVFEALTSDRPYRKAFTVPEALAEIEAQTGRQFDPELARKFIHLVDNLGAQTISQIPPPPWLGRRL
jgi:HD-GYP domain-containing protein (c-di-GMP phosphodiesterase class II)